MNVEVVLTENDPSLGKRGTVVKVSSGYANNFLIPGKKAVLATPSALKGFEAQKAREVKSAAETLSHAKKTAGEIEGASLEIAVLTGEGEKLYGAVTAHEIQEALAAKYGIRLEKKQLQLEEPIRKLGAYEVNVRLHPDVKTKLKVLVSKKAD